MITNPFSYHFTSDPVVFTDTLYHDRPCIFTIPRNHESLFLVTDGDMLYERNGQTTVVKKGQVGYIARGSIDRTMPWRCGAVSYIAVNFNRDTEDLTQTLPFPVLCSSAIQPYHRLFFEAYELYSIKSPGYQTVCSGIMLQIIGSLYRELRSENDAGREYTIIKPAMEYLLQNYADPMLHISALGQLCAISEKHFRRLFVKVFSEKPYAYLTQLRLSHAETLIMYTDKSITEIAQQCGFSDLYSFSHSFKTKHGISPTEYKIRNRK